MSKLVVSIDHIEFTIENDIYYVIKVTQNDEHWQVGRRKSDFRRLRNDILSVIKDETICCTVSSRGKLAAEYARSVEKLILPSWRLFGRRKDHVVKERATLLHHFLSHLLLLTHRFRKAEKKLYENCPSLPNRLHASIHALYRIRDFLEPKPSSNSHNYHRSPELSDSGKIQSSESSIVHKIPDESDTCVTISANSDADRTDKKQALASKLLNVSLMPANGQEKIAREHEKIKNNVRDHSKNSEEIARKLNAKNSSSSQSSLKNVHKVEPLTQNRQLKDSERMTRLSSQLTAQRITIEAQKELEKSSLTEYEAIMVLRYVDRFINKAVDRAPGCYVVTDELQLRIDSERFLIGLEEVFSFLPRSFHDSFRDKSGEWRFPTALSAYVQLKWDSLCGSFSRKSDVDSSAPKCHDAASEEDSESEYEYENVKTGGYMKAKKPAFSQEEADVLQEMIACGTAGRDQELRLRRQMTEQKWNSRVISAVSSTEALSDCASESEEEEEDAGPSIVLSYQQRMNAKRRDRLSQAVG